MRGIAHGFQWNERIDGKDTKRSRGWRVRPVRLLMNECPPAKRQPGRPSPKGRPRRAQARASVSNPDASRRSGGAEPESGLAVVRGSRWVDYDTHELLEMISELEDERRWARLREGHLARDSLPSGSALGLHLDSEVCLQGAAGHRSHRRHQGAQGSDLPRSAAGAFRSSCNPR